MIKKTFLFLLLLSINFLSSQTSENQKIYEFDYILEFGYERDDSSRIKRHFKLVNSKNKEYLAFLIDINEDQFKISFSDWEMGLSSKSVIDKDSLLNSTTINLGANYEFYRTNKDDRDYKLERLNDTIIDGSKYKFYRFFKKKKKVGGTYFAIQEVEDFNYLDFYSYHIFKRNNKVVCPNGILKLYYILDDKGDFVEGNGTKLLDYQKLNKHIILEIKE